jgi:hypothetical protein
MTALVIATVVLFFIAVLGIGFNINLGLLFSSMVVSKQEEEK